MKPELQAFNSKKGWQRMKWDLAKNRYAFYGPAAPEPWPGIPVSGRQSRPPEKTPDDPPTEPEPLEKSGYGLSDW